MMKSKPQYENPSIHMQSITEPRGVFLRIKHR